MMWRNEIMPIPEGLSIERGLGRLLSIDPRDERFPLGAIIEPPATIASRTWRVGPILDQGAEPQCVGFAWRAWMAAAPLMTSSRSAPAPDWIYREAQKVDEWPGEGYAGTSVRAGAKVLEALGRILEYRWAFDAATVRDHILMRGPVVLGIDWYEGMTNPDPKGIVHTTGRPEGGHAILCAGFDHRRDLFKLVNSWGPAWGIRGRAWIGFDELDFLLRRRGGEACSAIECRPTR
jgi:hypothetical protein